MSPQKLKVNTILSAENVLKELNLPVENHIDPFCERLSMLDEEEQNFLLSLTREFYTEGIQTILDNIRTALIDLGDKLLEEASHIILMPLVKPADRLSQSNGHKNRRKVKSGEFVYELFKRNHERWMFYWDKFRYCDTADALGEMYAEGDLLVFIDDFVGSGNTVVETTDEVVNYYKENTGDDIPRNKIAIIAPVMMSEGRNRLIQEGYLCGANKIFRKGISENERIKQEFGDKRSVDLMLSIEKKVVPQAVRNYSFGYSRSESLTQIMQKTPNNTFPIYWYGNRPIFFRDVL